MQLKQDNFIVLKYVSFDTRGENKKQVKETKC